MLFPYNSTYTDWGNLQRTGVDHKWPFIGYWDNPAKNGINPFYLKVRRYLWTTSSRFVVNAMFLS